MTKWHIVCPECDAIDCLVGRIDPAMSDEQQTGGSHFCSECGHVFGIWIDAGILDLGLSKETIAIQQNDVQKEPWSRQTT